MEINENHNLQDPHRWVVFGAISSVYFFVYFHRVSTSVIAPDLLAAFQAQATALGLMSSMYFYAYALEQPFVGYLSDKIGPRRVIGYWSLVTALGCVFFGLAPNIAWASVGRTLIGFGLGGVYVPAMKAMRQWFKARDFATMIGLLLAAGNIGAIAATTPLAWVVGWWGWRPSFFAMGAVTLALALTVLLLVRDYPAVSNRAPGEPLSMDKAPQRATGSVRKVLASFRFWVLAVIFFMCFGTFLTFLGLWATPYLMSVYNLSRLHASEVNMLVPLGFAVGAPLFGRLTDRLFRDKVHVLITILGMQVAVWVGVTYGPQVLGLGGMMPLLFAMGGMTGGFATALWGLVRETTPEPIMGAATGLMNLSPFFGVAAFQVLTGVILDRIGPTGELYPPEAFRNAFLVCLLTNVCGFGLSACFRKRLYAEDTV